MILRRIDVLMTLFFIIHLFLEAWHDWHRAEKVRWSCIYDFKQDRISKQIKFWLLKVPILSIGSWLLYFTFNYPWWKPIVIYVICLNILFHPFYRLFSHGPKFVFSLNGIKWMIEHSEYIYWILILFGKKREAEAREIIAKTVKSR